MRRSLTVLVAILLLVLPAAAADPAGQASAAQRLGFRILSG
jgi:hypothetical protein